MTVLEPRQPVGDRDDLVDLLLVLHDGELHLRVVEHVGHLVGHRVLVDRHGDAADALHGGEGRIESRPVVADDGHRVAALEAELAQADRRTGAPRRAAAPRSRSARCRSPCGAWPAGRHGARVAQQQLGYRVERGCRRTDGAHGVVPPLSAKPPLRAVFIAYGQPAPARCIVLDGETAGTVDCGKLATNTAPLNANLDRQSGTYLVYLPSYSAWLTIDAWSSLTLGAGFSAPRSATASPDRQSVMPPRSVTSRPAASSRSRLLLAICRDTPASSASSSCVISMWLPGVRIQHRVEQPGQMARDPGGRIVDAVALDGGDELAHALVELVHQEACEADARFEQPHEGGAVHHGEVGIAQGDQIVLDAPRS